jgi:uncharacterized protein (DUF427 family)
MTTALIPPGPAPGFAKNPDRQLDFKPSPRRVRVKFNGATIVDSTRAMLMREGGHVPIYYFPIADVAMNFFAPSDHETHCGYKGHASYWTLNVEGRIE